MLRGCRLGLVRAPRIDKSWDANNQLSSATVNGTTTDYAYDGDGNQVSHTSNGTTTTNLWDTNSGMSELVDDGSSRYVQADGAQEAIDNSNTASYPLTDALSSPLALPVI